MDQLLSPLPIAFGRALGTACELPQQLSRLSDAIVRRGALNKRFTPGHLQRSLRGQLRGEQIAGGIVRAPGGIRFLDGDVDPCFVRSIGIDKAL